MKVVYTFPIDSLSGAGTPGNGLVFKKWRNGNYASQYVKPSNPQSTNQILIRNFMTQAAQGYSQLSAATKALWEAYAANFPIDVNGKSVVLPAGNLYQRINVLRLIDGQSISSTVPSSAPDFVATSITSAVWTNGTSTLAITVAHNDTVITGDLWKVEITPNISSDVVTIKDGDYRLAMGVNANSIVAVSSSPQVISLASPVTGKYTENDFVGIRLTPLNSAYAPGSVYTSKQTVQIP